VNSPTSDEPVIACAPTTGRCTVGSVIVNCLDCGIDVWLSVSGQNYLTEYPKAHILCVACALKRAEQEGVKEFNVVPGAVQELRDDRRRRSQN
jgi:hypothetical protein